MEPKGGWVESAETPTRRKYSDVRFATGVAAVDTVRLKNLPWFTAGGAEIPVMAAVAGRALRRESVMVARDDKTEKETMMIIKKMEEN
jgi:hypothetical protein